MVAGGSAPILGRIAGLNGRPGALAFDVVYELACLGARLTGNIASFIGFTRLQWVHNRGSKPLG